MSLTPKAVLIPNIFTLQYEDTEEAVLKKKETPAEGGEKVLGGSHMSVLRWWSSLIRKMDTIRSRMQETDVLHTSELTENS